MKVPGFLARQFYVEGSLRNTPTGFRLEAQNPLGNGTLIGVGRMAVDGREIAPEAVSAQRDGDDERIQATDVSTRRYITVSQGDRVVLFVDGPRLEPGNHTLEVQLTEVNLGRLSFAITDKLSED